MPALFVSRYELVSYDENYEKYLKALGIPFFVVPLIVGASETLEFEASDDPEQNWVMTVSNGEIYFHFQNKC